MSNLTKIATIRDNGLLDQLHCREELWHQITARQKHPESPHKDTEAIFLRWAEDLSVEAVFKDIPAIDYPASRILTLAEPLIHRIYNLVDGEELGRAMIVKLKPGGKITPHVDEGAYADYYERFHYVLSSEEGNVFGVGTSDLWQQVEMKKHELWYFNHKVRHWAENNSSTDRIHLIVDIVSDRFRKEREPHAVSA